MELVEKGMVQLPLLRGSQALEEEKKESNKQNDQLLTPLSPFENIQSSVSESSATNENLVGEENVANIQYLPTKDPKRKDLSRKNVHSIVQQKIAESPKNSSYRSYSLAVDHVVFSTNNKNRQNNEMSSLGRRSSS